MAEFTPLRQTASTARFLLRLAWVALPLPFLLLPCAATAQTETTASASDLLLAVSQRLWGVDQGSLITVTEKDRSDSTRTRQFRFQVHYPQTADSIAKQTLMEVVAPEKLVGQKYWLWVMNDGRERTWIYLPRMGRLQEIQRRPGSRNQNREIDLRELNITPQQIKSHTHRILESSPLDGHQVVLIKSIEKDTGSRQSRQDRHPDYKLLWVDPEALLVRKAELYSGRDKLIKRYTVETTSSVNGYTVATRILVWDAQRKRETIITVDELDLDPVHDPHLFRPVAE